MPWSRPAGAPLSGLVEVDKTEITCRSKNDSDDRRCWKQPTMARCWSSVPSRFRISGSGRIRLTTVPDDSAASLHAFLAASVAPGTTAQTSGEAGYCGGPGINDDPRVIGALDPPLKVPVHGCTASSPTSKSGP